MEQEKEQSQPTAIALIDTRSLAELDASRRMLKAYISEQMTRDVDYGIIPGTKKECLFKPGAEKLAKLFRLGSRIVSKDKELDREHNFAFFSYVIEMYHLDSGRVISQCEGSANSDESKHRSRKSLGDILNTLQKMAQKRAFVGAVISGVAASDFYTQDMEDFHEPSKEVKLTSVETERYEPPRQLEPFNFSQDEEPPPQSDYVIPFGKHRGKRLAEVEKRDLESYCRWLVSDAQQKGKPMGQQAQDFINKSKTFLHGTNE